MHNRSEWQKRKQTDWIWQKGYRQTARYPFFATRHGHYLYTSIVSASWFQPLRKIPFTLVEHPRNRSLAIRLALLDVAYRSLVLCLYSVRFTCFVTSPRSRRKMRGHGDSRCVSLSATQTCTSLNTGFDAAHCTCIFCCATIYAPQVHLYPCFTSWDHR